MLVDETKQKILKPIKMNVCCEVINPFFSLEHLLLYIKYEKEQEHNLNYKYKCIK